MAVPDPGVESIIELLAALVRTPSRAGEDTPAAVASCLERWFDARALPYRRLRGPGAEPLGLYAEVRGQRPDGFWIVLDATLDTAGFGNPATWSHGPTEAVQRDGWLYGRGSADSKAGVALFAHLLQEWAAPGRAPFAGRFGVLFDLDEHSGRFGGARAFFDLPHDGQPPPRPDGVIIGYPGIDHIVTGGRGFVRACVAVPGIAAHSGATRERGLNAIERGVALAQALLDVPLPLADGRFGLAPQLTLTGMQGGGTSFSQVPDLCELRLDLRLTPGFDDAAARSLVEDALRRHDARYAAAAPCSVQWLPGWPAYRVDDAHPMVLGLQEAARTVLGQPLPTKVVGPSNIGNYLATLQVPALCGFGVRGRNIHAADECIELASIDPVYRIYRELLHRLLRP